jgi:hypothetical protein
MVEIKEFPIQELSYRLKCSICGCRTFYIDLDSRDSEDYKGYTCANEECEAEFSFSDVECAVDGD